MKYLCLHLSVGLALLFCNSLALAQDRSTSVADIFDQSSPILYSDAVVSEENSNQFAVDALSAVMLDVWQRHQQQSRTEGLTQRHPTLHDIIMLDLDGDGLTSGTVTVSNVLYSYNIVDGMIEMVSLMSDRGRHHIDARRLLKEIAKHSAPQSGFGDAVSRPLWVIPAGIIVLQGLCSLTEGGSHSYCSSTCRCGVASVTTTCVAGFRSTTCECYACPTPDQPPIPPDTHPGTGGWNGPLGRGMPWVSPSCFSLDHNAPPPIGDSFCGG